MKNLTEVVDGRVVIRTVAGFGSGRQLTLQVQEPNGEGSRTKRATGSQSIRTLQSRYHPEGGRIVSSALDSTPQAKLAGRVSRE